jgi:hypothetical protein
MSQKFIATLLNQISFEQSQANNNFINGRSSSTALFAKLMFLNQFISAIY